MTNGGAIARLLLFVPLLLGMASVGSPPAGVAAEEQCFPQTGQCVSDAFYQYWQANGGLAQQGLPLTGEFQEVSAIDGKTYTVQYFERARFESHPENQPPFNILLGQLGREQFQTKYPQGRPPGGTGDTCFEQTGRCVSGAFIAYWRANGGLAQQGFPVSDEFDEVSPTDGKTYRVQYFERARFELHPELTAGNQVLLGLLGREQLAAKYPIGKARVIEGTGDQNISGVNLAAGLAFFKIQRTADDPLSPFKVTLRDPATGRTVETLASQTGSFDGTASPQIGTAAPYALEVRTVGKWRIAISQFSYEDLVYAPPLPQSFRGKGAANTPLFKANAGPLKLAMKYTGKSYFNVRLFDGQGRYIDIPANETGAYEGTVTITLPRAGAYILIVNSDDEWSIAASQ